MARELTHIDERGRARMVDVGDKVPSRRVAVASGRLRMDAATRDRVVHAGPMPDPNRVWSATPGHRAPGTGPRAPGFPVACCSLSPMPEARMISRNP